MPLLVRSDDAEHQAEHLHRPDEEKQWNMTWNTACLNANRNSQQLMNGQRVKCHSFIGNTRYKFDSAFRNLNLNC